MYTIEDCERQPGMYSRAYLELCRRFVSDRFGVHLLGIRSRSIRNPSRKERSSYRHRVDLYWKTEDALARYVHIAHVRWREAALIGLANVLFLQRVKEKLAAHKAILITNVGFTRKAIAAAENEGMNLIIVRPTFDLSGHDFNPRFASESPYVYKVVQ